MPVQPPPPADPPVPPRPTVVLVHGLGRSPRSMRPIERAAIARGYRVLNVGYPSRRAGVERHARDVAAIIAAEVPHGPLYVVTHSLGGIVLREAVASGALPAARVARAVMLAPPGQGSEVADAFTGWPLLRVVGRLALGPSGAELRTAPGSLVRRQGPVPFSLGVVAGTRSMNPLLSLVIPGPDDGKVAVVRAAVPGMRAFVALPHTHTFMMHAGRVLDETFAFLEHGRFTAGAEGGRPAP